MNVIWSKYIQGIKTLYYSRKLRFDDRFSRQYEEALDLDEHRDLKILEVGCGPGALAGALRRWYPKAEITGIDRDSAFINFAREHEPGVEFLEGDAAALPFADASFDVTISNTVSEHIEPSAFYAEQYRVLKPGGKCIVLSSRKGLHVASDCIADSDSERRFWKRVAQYDDSMERYSVCQYPMSEAELPLEMQKHGFKDVGTGYVAVNLTPDNPEIPDSMAHDIIQAGRYTALEAVESVLHTMPEHVTVQEIEEMKRHVDAKYDERIRRYNAGEKQWDTSVSIIMIVRGTK